MKNEISIGEPDTIYQEEIESASFKPVFIMGLQRSGTSILYKTLTLTNCFNSITAYDIIKFDELVYNHINGIEQEAKKKLNDFLISKSQNTRAIDNLEINLDFPEEYGFLLAKKTGESVLSNYNISYLILLCKKIQFISKNNKPILLKNPYDFGNFLFIKEFFPNLKLIFIHRNPVNTLNSQIRALDGLLKDKSLYMELLSPEYAKIFENKLLLNHYKRKYSVSSSWRFNNSLNKFKKATDYFIENLGYLNKNDYIHVSYERLCNDPEKVISTILRFLKLKKCVNIDFKKLIKPRKLNLVDGVSNKQLLIGKKLSKYISFLKNQNLM